MIALLQTSQNAFLESAGWAVATIYVKTFVSFVFPGSLPDITTY